MRHGPLASFLLALSLSTSTLTVGTAAFAQDDATTKAARARFKEGVDFYDKGQFESARAAFLQAYALKKHPAMLLNLGQSSVRSGHPGDAAKYFQQFLREASSLTDAQRRDAETGLAEARAKLGRVTVNAPTATEITVDGNLIGAAPLSDTIDLEPGNHTLRAKYTDGIIDTKSLSITAGEKQSVTLSRDTSAPKKEPVVAPLVEERPKATEPPKSEPKPEPPIDSPPPADTKEKPGLLSPPKSIAPVIIGGGIAVVGGVVAIVMSGQKSTAESNANSVERQIRDAGGGKGICSSTNADDVRRFGKACGTLRDDLNLVDTDATIGNVALGIGIAGAVFGLGWYLFSEKKGAPPPATARVRVLPFISGESRGGSATLTF